MDAPSNRQLLDGENRIVLLQPDDGIALLVEAREVAETPASSSLCR
jgi:hypothetical protein